MNLSENKNYINLLKIIFGLSTIIVLAAYCGTLLFQDHNLDYYIIFNVIGYFDILFVSTAFIGLLRKNEEYYIRYVFIAPLIPTLFNAYHIFKAYGEISSSPIYVIFIIIIYIIYLLFTRYVVDLISSATTMLLIGKLGNEYLGDDFRCISIYSKNVDVSTYSQSMFIGNIIENVLGYSYNGLKTISIDGNDYNLIDFKKDTDKNILQKDTNHILLMELECVDNNIFDENQRNRFDGNIPAPPSLINVEMVDISEEDYINSDIAYTGLFIYQFREDKDGIYYKASIDDTTYLTFANLLTNTDRKVYFNDYGSHSHENNKNGITYKKTLTLLHRYIVIYHKDDDIASGDLFQLRSKLCRNFIEKKYSAAIDIYFSSLQNILTKKHIRTKITIASIIVLVVILAYLINIYTNDMIQTALLIFAMPSGIYSAILLYKQMASKNK